MTSPESSSGKRDEQPVFNNRLLHPLLKYYAQRYGRQELEEMVAELGVDLSFLAADDGWISPNLVLGISQHMVVRSGNARLTYEAGMELVDPKFIGASYWVLRAMGDPRVLYSQLGNLNLPLSKITRWEAVEVGRSRATLRFHVARGHADDLLFCLNRQGALAGIPKGLGLPPARVRHPRCIHEGDPFCEYHVEWEPPERGGRLVAVTIGLASLMLVGMWLLGNLPTTMLVIPLLLVLVLESYLLWVRARRYSLVLESLAKLNSERKAEYEQEHRRYREFMSLRRVDQKLRQHMSVTALIETALKEITTTLSYERAAYLHRDRGRRVFRLVRSEGFDGHHKRAIRRLEIAFPEGSGILDNALRSRHALLCGAEGETMTDPAVQDIATALDNQNFLTVPMATQDETLGVLLVDHGSSERVLVQRDAEFVEQFCNLVSLALANARLVEDLRKEHRNLQTALLINQKYSQYLPEPVVEQLRRDPGSAGKLGGAPVSATVLFSDIVDFTPWSEARSPMEVVAALNQYFGAMDAIIVETSGILDKRMGDGLMVVFLHPEGVNTDFDDDDQPSPDDSAAMPTVRHPAWRALECGLKMQSRMAEMRHEAHGEAAFEVRIGIAHGLLVAGNLGSAHRLEYTVIGDVVNLASRLCDLAEPNTILTTRRVLQAASFTYQATPVGHISVKGRVEPVDAFRVEGKGVRYKAASIEPEEP